MDEIFSKIAKQHNTTKEQVKKDISLALNLAVKNSKGNPKAEKFWNNLLQDKKKPIPEDIIKIITSKIIKDKNKL